MPDFGLDSDEIRELASPGCPPAFIELAIDCVTVDVNARPNIRQVLERLMAIEREVVEKQAATEKTYNVGSLTFTAKNTGRKRAAGSKRPAGPGRIPSFQGQIEGPKYSDSEKDEIGDTSDEDVDDTLAKLSKLQIGNGRTGSALYLHDCAKGTSTLAFTENGDKAERPNTYSVIKGSKAANRSSIIFREPEFVDAPTVSSSIMTVKPDHIRQESVDTPASLSSFPGSSIRMAKGKTGEQAATLQKKSAAASNAHPQGTDVFGTPSIIEKSHFSDETVDHPQEVPNEGDFHTSIEATAVAVLPEDIVAADRFATIKSMSMPVPAPESLTVSPPLSPDKKAFSPHRFTLIKPGWRALWEGKTRYTPPGQMNERNGQGRRRTESGQGIAGVLPMQLLGAGLLTRCYVCEKRLGLMKPYLACDDCQHV